MEPVSIAIICVAAFGVVAALTAFIRQLLLSRDKNLNDLAQQRALTQEAEELEKMRVQMGSAKRFDSHYQVLGANKDAIQYLDQKIDDLLRKKSELIQRYGQVTMKESSAIVAGSQLPERKVICDRLKDEVENELATYDKEIEKLQARRAALWESHKELQDYLLAQEKSRNESLDSLYQQHSTMLEKIYLRHNENSEAIAKQSIEASTTTFKALFSAPLEFFMAIFKISRDIAPDTPKKEILKRREVMLAELDINDEESYGDPRSQSKTLDHYLRGNATSVV